MNAARPAAADAVLHFWFEELTPEDWFRKDPSVDRRIAERFGSTLAAAFANDTLALALAQEAVAHGCDLELPVPQRVFLYLPWMHSESALLHEQALQLFATPEEIEFLGQPGSAF